MVPYDFFSILYDVFLPKKGHFQQIQLRCNLTKNKPIHRHLPGTPNANFKTSFLQNTPQGLLLNIITQHHFKVASYVHWSAKLLHFKYEN